MGEHTPEYLVDKYNSDLAYKWEQGLDTDAIEYAKLRGAVCQVVPGHCVIASFEDGSYALIANNGHCVLCTWIGEDVVGRNRPRQTKPRLTIVPDDQTR